MWRSIHSWLGLIFAIPILVIAITGTILSVKPMMQSYGSAVQNLDNISVAEMLRRAAQSNPRLSIDRVRVSDENVVMLKGRIGNRRIEKPVNVRSGELFPTVREGNFFAFIRDLHRAFLINKLGRMISLFSAVALFGMLLSGVSVLMRQMGGWRLLLARIQSRNFNWLHSSLARLALFPLLVATFTGIYLGLVTFGFIDSGKSHRPYYPETPIEGTEIAAFDLVGLQNLPMAGLRELLYPIPGDWFDVYAIKTNQGYVFVDQFTGDVLSSEPYSGWQVVLETMNLLHTGEGLPLWGLVAGVGSLAIPVFIVSGTVIWWRRREPHTRKNITASRADLVILVGSEGGTTFGFARHLHERLTALGKKVHLTAMNRAKPAYPKAQTIITFAATYGDGDAPQNATKFVKKVESSKDWPKSHLVLGFGDKSFPKYCAFAHEIDGALTKSGSVPLLAPCEIDRKSSQNFRAWGDELAKVTDLPLVLDYVAKQPKTTSLTLVERVDFGHKSIAPSAILRFKANRGKLPRFQAGDLIAIAFNSATPPRYYSLASSKKDGYVEICVVQHPHGICSTFLTQLLLGDNIEAFISPNPDFAVTPKKSGTIMIAAGTGIAPFAGIIRQNIRRRPLDLFWGNRHPEWDYYYRTFIENALETGQLSRFHSAFSRLDNGEYIQSKIQRNSGYLRQRIQHGATVMVCGSAKMANSVRSEIEIITGQIGSSLNELKKHKRYLEDVY